MSKAFTRESDDVPEQPAPPRTAISVPPGVKNYLTPGGAQRLQEELASLLHVERPSLLASSADNHSNSRHQLQILDQRILHLQQSLQSAVIVPPPAPPWERVRFGATVTVHDSRGTEARYRIVGMDETDLEQNCVSFRSPIAKALLNAQLRQCIRFQAPAGEEELQIIRITYD
jgi:transcription elongation factor GreB